MAKRLSDTEQVQQFFEKQDHQLTEALKLVRSIILDAGPEIAEAIKWNCPSFYVRDSNQFFATININPRNKPKHCVHIIFHQGAKVKDAAGPSIKDPNGLLEWLGKDRSVTKFYSLQEVKKAKPSLQDIIRQWIAQM